LIKTGLPPELKVARVVVIVKPGRRDRTKVKSSAAFPNTSRNEVRDTLKNADLGIAQWVDEWLDNRRIAMELDGHRGSIQNSRSGLPQGLPLSPVLFSLTCRRILKELSEGCSYVDDCAWTISFDNLGDENELASKVRRLLDQAHTVFCKQGMELDEQNTELTLISKVNQK
jgi:hypothetical protein